VKRRTLAVGDVYRHFQTGEIVLIGDVNKLSGVCDDCTNGMLSDTLSESFDYFVTVEWNYLGSVRSAVAELSK
jgi:hypothetical protein